MKELIFELLKINLLETEQKKKEAWFEERTNKHIGLVQGAASKIVKVYPEYSELLELVKNHDASKFEEPERTPYIELTWQHKDDNYKSYKTPGTISDKDINDATLHHIKNNEHHPEFWNKDKANLNTTNRDDSIECITCYEMPDIAVAEMVSDWQAMSEELGTNTAREWFEKTKDTRWSYTEEQVALIDKLLSVFEKDIKEAIQKIKITASEGPPEGEYGVDFLLVNSNGTQKEYSANAPQKTIKTFKYYVSQKWYGKAINIIKSYIK